MPQFLSWVTGRMSQRTQRFICVCDLALTFWLCGFGWLIWSLWTCFLAFWGRDSDPTSQTCDSQKKWSQWKHLIGPRSAILWKKYVFISAEACFLRNVRRLAQEPRGRVRMLEMLKGNWVRTSSQVWFTNTGQRSDFLNIFQVVWKLRSEQGPPSLSFKNPKIYICLFDLVKALFICKSFWPKCFSFPLLKGVSMPLIHIKQCATHSV